MHLRAEIAAGRGEVAIDDGKFSLADYRGFLTDNDDGIAAFRQQHGIAAFAAERRACDPWPGSSAGRPKACSPSCGTLSTAH